MSRDRRPQEPTRDVDRRTDRPTTRRAVLGGTVGVGLSALGITGTERASAQETRPDFGGWLDGVDGGFEDARGRDEVTVEVGAAGNGGDFAFAPAGLWVDSGTTVRWEWTGNGGGHNVVAEDGADLDSGSPVAEPGVHYEHTFDEGGISTYFCDPHRSLEMKGAVAVGDGVPTANAGGGEPAEAGAGGTTAWSPPGGPIGFAFTALMLGSAGLAAMVVFAGEFYGSVRRRSRDGHTSAYLAAAGAGLLGLVLIAAITVRLVTAG